MIYNFDVPSCDLADYGDHTGMSKLITEVGLPIHDSEYWYSNESVDVPDMVRLA